MKYQNNLKLIVCVVLSFLASCSPVYKNSYEYVQPKDKAIRACTSKCSLILSRCTNVCRNQNQMCRIRNNVPMRPGVRGVRGGVARRRVCTSSCNSCNVSYRNCYTNCGGEVITKRTCSAFCG